MKPLDADRQKTISPVLALFIFVILAAVGGWGGYKIAHKPGVSGPSTNGASVQTDKAAGVTDKSTFKDSSDGILKEGGIEGEGNFHIDRPGGVSQTVYLTSSTVDLSKYVGKKVKVWGQTYQGQKAGWLMDVGLVEIQ